MRIPQVRCWLVRMPRRTSAGLLAFLTPPGVAGRDWDPETEVRVFLGHMGGPFWARRDEGAWSIPKGEYDEAAEEPPDAARREFREEIGVTPPEGPLLDLGVWSQRSGKQVHAFAVRSSARLAFVSSNEFEMEWPPRSGRIHLFPEIDRAEWFTVGDARRKVVSGQEPILDALVRALREPDIPG